MTSVDSSESDLYMAIRNEVFTELKTYLGKDDFNYVIKRFGSGEKFLKSICLLGLWFNESFTKKRNLRKHFFYLGCANLQAWIAYTMYDYIRDHKIETRFQTKILSIANILHQKSLVTFINYCPPVIHFYEEMDKYYLDSNKITNFNTELSRLYKKSIGIFIVPYIVLFLRDLPLNNQSYKLVHNFFKYYITARQLSDDLDDVDIDLKNKDDTLVTFLIRTGKSRKYTEEKIRSTIEKQLTLSIRNIKQIKDFDFESFKKRYVRDC